MTMCTPEVFGTDPVNITWQVIRGDSSSLRIEFLENDEETYFGTSTWTFDSTTYDFRGDVLDQLEVSIYPGYVDIVAPAEITELWGIGYSKSVAELAFDLQVTFDDNTIWTPVLGTIRVLGDVTPGGL